MRMSNRNNESGSKRSEILKEMDACVSEEGDVFLNCLQDEFPAEEYTFRPMSYQYTRKKGLARYSNAAKHLLPFRKKKMEKNRLRIDEAGIFSLFTFSWMSKYIYQAYKKSLTIDDMPIGSPFDSCDLNSQRLESVWHKELLKKGPKKALFGVAVWKFVRTRILISSVVFSITCIMGFLTPTIFMRKLLEYLEDPNDSQIHGVIWALALTGSELLRVMFFALYYSLSYRTAMRLRAACLGMVYRKILRLNSARNTSTGEIINLFAFDGPRLYYMIIFGPMIIGGPVLSICGILYIYYILGSWALLGMLVFLAYYPTQYLLSHLTGYFRQKSIKESDGRIKLMTEILTHIKLIKLYAWENWFSTRIRDVRKSELSGIERIAYCHSVGISLAPTVPVISGIVTFLVHVAAGGNLTAAQAYPIFVVFVTQLRTALANMRYGSENFIQGRIITNRLQEMLMLDENSTRISRQLDNSLALTIENGFFSWNVAIIETKKSKKGKKERKKLTEVREEAAEVLHSINLSVPKGALIGICGPVGSGKSSLLMACLGQLKVISGQVSRSGSCAYVSQQSWIENTSVKENILFGEKFDAKKYINVIHCCCLGEDINFLPGGDETEIGGNGANLSGGQKQRVSLARAVYSDRDIYFLDDPFSAVDPQLAVQIFEKCILGMLEKKTVILVSPQIHFLEKCDEILVLKSGQIVERGTYTELVSKGKEFEFMIQSLSWPLPSQKTVEEGDNEAKKEENSAGESNSNLSGVDSSYKTKFPQAKSLTEAEEQIKGTVKSYAYHAYMKAAGGYLVAFGVVMIIFLNVGSNVFSSWWLAMWIKAGSGNATVVDPATNKTVISRNINDNPKLPFYMQVYGSIIGLVAVTCVMRGFTYTKVTIRASRNLHQNLFERVIKSPMSYFERTPIGRIQNLFSRDFDEVDSILPETMETMLQNIWSLLFSFLSITLVFPWFVVPLAIFGCLYYFISKIFRVAIRDLKRIDNICRAPVFSSISATVQGLPTIHAFNREKDFIAKFSKLFDENLTVLFLSSNAMRWMAVRLDLISVVLNFITSFLVTFLKGEVAPAFSGLALTYAAQICGVFQYTVRLMSENEARFISVERIQSNIEKLSPEGNSKTEVKVAEKWPTNGKIEFEEVVLSYGKDLPQVLNGISFSIKGGEKIGVVGRTGAGKSSLAVALFRLVELASGRITIDGVNIARVPLTVLRSRLSVIPQDPVLFSDSLRSNLDPLNQFEDSHLWEALRKTKLLSKVKSLPEQLSTYVGEGENLSVGEKQLVCLARILLRGSKILILDEATASIDPETEIAVQTTIQEEFKDRTVITIAHRLSTVTNCDRILVVDHGTILEFDDPRVLKENPKSQFAKMLGANDRSRYFGEAMSQEGMQKHDLGFGD